MSAPVMNCWERLPWKVFGLADRPTRKASGKVEPRTPSRVLVGMESSNARFKEKPQAARSTKQAILGANDHRSCRSGIDMPINVSVRATTRSGGNFTTTVVPLPLTLWMVSVPP